MEQQTESGRVLTRRAFLRQLAGLTGTAAGAALLAACGATGAAPTAAPTQAAAATATAAATAAPTATAAAAATAVATAAATEAATAATAAGQGVTAATVAAANAFLATLDDTQKGAAQFDWSDTAQKQRWSNLPEGLYSRAGLMWGNLSDAQRTAWLAVMQATLSAEGYARVMAEWDADDALAAGQTSGGSSGPGGQLKFGKQYYWVAIIGSPSESEPWQWQWGGHHVTVNATLVGEKVALTPSFIGVQPASYTDASGSTVRPLGDIEDEAFALVGSLDAAQQKAAVLGDTAIDLVLGPGQDGKTIQGEGLAAAQMTADQQAALLKLVGHYTGLVGGAMAAARLAEVQSTLDQTFFAWYGPTAAGSAAYFRVSGPAVVIEYAPQGGGSNGLGLGGAATANHIHGIYRDPSNDYGAKYTA